ncbi:MAG: hypothetical protein WCX78_02360 [Patescibacteria group bacterium]|jgi:hypothetical protein
MRNINNNENPTAYILRIYKNSKLAHRYDTRKYKRFIHLTKLMNWKKDIVVYLRVNYKGQKNSHNDMTCYSKNDLDWGIEGFVKEYL